MGVYSVAPPCPKAHAARGAEPHPPLGQCASAAFRLWRGRRRRSVTIEMKYYCFSLEWLSQQLLCSPFETTKPHRFMGFTFLSLLLDRDGTQSRLLVSPICLVFALYYFRLFHRRSVHLVMGN
ncbi:hypothetical protein TRVL_07423 [Trypanosoma vivax]|nr:hypothetical protein TRVL_07423 [Trypanosoma vivax]